MAVLEDLIKESKIAISDIKAIGITNQRETTVIWDKETGKPIYNAIVWQDKRTADICEQIKKDGLEEYIKKNTGLVVDSYFSATKVMWLLEHVEGAREKAEKGTLLFGTIDSWLIWKLSNGQRHVTDYTNASRTMLFNIKNLEWDDYLLKKLNIPHQILPDVQECASDFGSFEYKGSKIPITGVAGDQQAALFGQACFETGMAKNTYGTGCFMLMNTGEKLFTSQNGLLTTIAWGIDAKVSYALEGSIFIAGAAIQWLRDGLQIIDSAPASEELAAQAEEDHGVYVVPAFAGLGAPYWDMYARGAVFGLTRGSGKAELARATLDALAYQTRDVLHAMEEDTKLALQTLKVDGGASANNILMQFQADILGVDVERPASVESTAAGTAYLAGYHIGLWDLETIQTYKEVDRIFEPKLSFKEREDKYNGWKEAVKRTLGWKGMNNS